MSWSKVAKPTATSTIVGKPVMYEYLLAKSGSFLLARAGVKIIVNTRGNTWSKVAKPAL